MKPLIQKMNELRAKLLGIEMRLSIVEADVIEVNQQLIYLDAIQRDLIYNLKFLKRPDIVAVIASYNKSIVQLKEVQSRILKYRSSKAKLLDSLEKYENMQNTCYDDLDLLYTQIEGDKKILLFKKRE